MVEFYKVKPYARSEVVKLSEVIEPESSVRIYRESPFRASIQIRVAKAKTLSYCSATLTKADCLELAAYLSSLAIELDND